MESVQTLRGPTYVHALQDGRPATVKMMSMNVIPVHVKRAVYVLIEKAHTLVNVRKDGEGRTVRTMLMNALPLRVETTGSVKILLGLSNVPAVRGGQEAPVKTI